MKRKREEWPGYHTPPVPAPPSSSFPSLSSLRSPAPSPPPNDRAKRTSISRASSLRLCISCLEDKPPKDFMYPTACCAGNHTPDTCTTCLRNWIKHSLHEGGAVITCPECPAQMGYLSIREVADRATFDKYEALVLASLLDTNPTFVWCVHGCGSGQFHPAGDAEPIFTCHHCRLKTCVVHNLPWHPEFTCSQFDELLKEEQKRQQQQQSLAEKNRQTLLRRARDEEASRRLVVDVAMNFAGFALPLTER
ncbi:hypothetical protein NPX13_g1105 [Xylaria arbuscula]|uniref:RBR-type E3 ubiquitin transferase n=1 Tax=Xylaria arbuscula TaxID=114810 RepID=A0A9W8TS25_9PEZI|nr:hypothetical protein NPX13_g1105 [Xylaria arbuscula]